MISIDERTGSKAYQATWYQTNKERIRLREKARRDGDPELRARLAAKNKELYWKDTDKQYAQRRVNRKRPGDRARQKKAEDRYMAIPKNKEKRAASQARYSAKHPGAHRDAHLLRNYGISEIQYKTLLYKQGDVCAVCFQKETKTLRGVVLPLHVDHNHTTGKVRGLLCFTCNAALGLFKDSTDLLSMAISYLERAQ